MSRENYGTLDDKIEQLTLRAKCVYYSKMVCTYLFLAGELFPDMAKDLWTGRCKRLTVRALPLLIYGAAAAGLIVSIYLKKEKHDKGSDLLAITGSMFPGASITSGLMNRVITRTSLSGEDSTLPVSEKSELVMDRI